MRRPNAFLLSSVFLLTDCPGPCPCFFAGPDALVPRVTELGVTSTSAVSEPRAAATATTRFPGFPDCTTFEAYGTGGRSRGYWCVCVGMVKEM